MFEKILLPSTKQLLRKIKPENLPENSYLAGGTALALHLGHRRSADLDFFTPEEFIEFQWEQKLTQEIGFRLLKRDWQTLIGVAGGVKISIFGYKYELIGKLTGFYHIKVASLKDLAAMKLDAIIGRGTKRDLIDIYFLAQRFGLDKLFEYYDEKYANLKDKEIMIKKALVYFDDAEKDEIPDMFTDISWEEVKNWLRNGVLRTRRGM